MDDFVGWIIIGVGVLLALWLLFSVVHIVREYERLVVFFFGRLQGARGPGIVLLIPFVQQAVKVDLRERFLEVPQQTCITKDNAPISIDFLVYSKVFEPEVTVTAVVDFTGASQALAATTLRAVIGREANVLELQADLPRGGRGTGEFGKEWTDLGLHEQPGAAHAEIQEVPAGGRANGATHGPQRAADHPPAVPSPTPRV